MGNKNIWGAEDTGDPITAQYRELGFTTALKAVDELKSACRHRWRKRQEDKRTQAGLQKIAECVDWLQSDECVLYCGHRFTVTEIARICNLAIEEAKKDGRRNNGKRPAC